MVTKFKIFEQIDNLEIGDYVICKELDSNPSQLSFFDFIANNIGQCVKLLNKDNILVMKNFLK